jgi:Resolvase, N terminal domain/Recombinase
LTRALSDFAKLVEVFDRRGVSFVSITQQFNTTTSMGRLTLNVLLSFAQFEREVIGERVRDKIAASKKKGMWMGGMPPLGYDVKDRKLVVNRDEGRTVVDIYRRYLVLKSVRDLHDELAAVGTRSKRRVRPDGTTYGGQKIARGALYLMLQNRIYRGEITHCGRSYPGEHTAIIDQPLWDEVQAVLAQNRVERATGARTKHPSLLGGFVFDATSERLTPTYAIKKGTRYRYYVSSSLAREARGNRAGGWRLPAGDLEGLVIHRLRNFFADPAALLDTVDNDPPNGLGRSQLIKRHRARGARDRRLHLYASAAALAGTRHHNRNCQRSPTATTQRQNVSAQGLAAPRRLDRATHAARILKNLTRKVRFTRVHPRDLPLDASLRARECNKKVNHEMPVERIPSSLAPRYLAHFVSAANWTRVRVKNRRKMATKSMPPKEQKQPRYQ